MLNKSHLKTRALLYCRVSTEGQEQDGTSLGTQMEACRKYCEGRGYEIGYEFGEAWSGLSLERPKLTEVRELVRSDNVDAVVVYSLDRFSRDPVHGVILMQELEKHGVILEAATETVDNSEVGKLVFYIKGYAAKLDAERRRDATGRGKIAALKSGKLPQGTGIGIYGYQWMRECKKRTPLEREAKVVRRMFEMVAEGNSCFKIAKILNEEGVATKSGGKWEAGTISRIVRNPAYMGITYFGQTSGKDRKKKPQESWYVLPDVTPAVISKECFERAQSALAKSKEVHSGKAKHEYRLTGFAACGYCGSPLVGSCLRGDYRYYHCRGTYPTASREKICDARYIRAEWLEDVVWEKVKSVLCNPELLLAEIGEQSRAEEARIANGGIEEEIREVRRKVKQYGGQERRLIEALKVGFASDMVLDEMNQVKKDKEADEARLVSLIETREQIAKGGDYEGKLRELCARIMPELEKCTSQDKKDAYRYLDLRIRATPEGADIKGYLRPEVIDGDSYVLTTGQTWG